jgi:protein SDA1
MTIEIIHEFLKTLKTVEPVLMTIANHFITERNNSEVIAVGLNAIREICARCPLAMNEDLLGDLVQYRTYKDKAVSYAAKSLTQLFRETNPQMLQRKLRGKPTEEMYVEAGKVRQYGEIDAKNYVPGAEVVDLSDDDEEAEKVKIDKKKREKGDDNEDDDDDDDDENSWVEDSDEMDEEEAEDNEEDENKTKTVTSKKRKRSDDDDDEDEDEEEGWCDVSSGEEGEGNENEDDESKPSKLTLEEKVKKAADVSSQRIFTQEEFKKIRAEQLKKKVTSNGFVKGKENKKKMLKIDTDSDSYEENVKR